MVNIVYNMDCLEAMRQMPDKCYQLAIVDPPYGIGDNKLTQGGTWASKYKSGDASWDIAPSQEYFTELFRISKNQIIWGGNYFQLPKTRGFVIWDKVAHMDTMADCEYAWTSFDTNAKIFKCLRAGNQTGEERIHMCQKPVKLYKWLLTHYAKPGDKILDTHIGSGSIRIACDILGYDLTGYEIDKDYFDAQELRYQRHKAQGSIFEVVQTKQVSTQVKLF